MRSISLKLHYSLA